jgi:D-amino-acid dehydrogenase
MKRVAVIGAGITGVTTAYELLQRGFHVSLFERHRYVAMETSYANGGQLSASNAEVWNHWSNVVKGISDLTRADAPLALNLRLSWHKYSWLAEFLFHIRDYRRNTIATGRLALAAQKAMLEIAKLERISFDLEQRGILHVYKSEKSFAHAGHVNQMLVESGIGRRAVTPQEMTAIEPSLRGTYVGGYYTETDFTGDIHKFTQQLAEVCLRKGANLLAETKVVSITPGDRIKIEWCRASGMQDPVHRTEADQFDAVVVCAGVESRRLAKKLGDRVNIYPVKGYSITVGLDDASSRSAAPWVSLLDDDAKIVTSRLGGNRWRIAGTAELNGFNRDIRADRIEPLIDWVRRLFPDVATSNIIQWSGLRPMMPNMLPRVGRGKTGGIYYNTGHGHLGWTLSTATAQMIADTVLVDAK